jgi:hypothetical protein
MRISSPSTPINRQQGPEQSHGQACLLGGAVLKQLLEAEGDGREQHGFVGPDRAR